MKLQKMLWILPFVLFACAAPQKGADDANKKMHTEKKAMEQKASDAAPQAEAASGAGTVTCKLGSDERTITKTVSESGGCEVTYTKAGESKQVANAANDLSYCDQVVEKVKGNLVTAGFTCE